MDTQWPYVVSQGWGHTVCSMNTLLNYRAKANASLSTHHWCHMLCSFVVMLEALPLREFWSHAEKRYLGDQDGTASRSAFVQEAFSRKQFSTLPCPDHWSKREVSLCCFNYGESHWIHNLVTNPPRELVIIPRCALRYHLLLLTVLNVVSPETWVDHDRISWLLAG